MNLIVTVADQYYLKQAKQLFSSIYFNARWQGQCMLLANNINSSDLKWFSQRGIVIKKCHTLHRKPIAGYSPTVTCKLFIFLPEMKKWENIIYLDSDIIVKKSLEPLTRLKGFNAMPDNGEPPKANQFTKPKSIIQKFKMSILNSALNLNQTSFNSGVMVFQSSIIKQNTFNKLRFLLRMYVSLSRYGEQGVLNIYFHSNWNRLARKFNVFPKYFQDFFDIKPKNLNGSIIHFADHRPEDKPWHPHNYFYSEWLSNLNRSEEISFSDFHK